MRRSLVGIDSLVSISKEGLVLSEDEEDEVKKKLRRTREVLRITVISYRRSLDKKFE